MSDSEKQSALARVTAQYGDSATIHGVSIMLNPLGYKKRRYFWGLLVIAMFIGLIFILYTQFAKFFSYPIVTNVRVEFNDQITLPDITICNANQFHRQRIPNDTVLHEFLYNISELAYLSHYHEQGSTSQNVDTSTFTGTYLRDLALDAAHKLKDMFTICTWQGKYIDCNDYVSEIMTDMGKCFKFSSSNRTKLAPPMKTTGDSSNVLRLLLNIEQEHYFFSVSSQAGVKVLIHERDSEPLLLPNGFFAQPGTATSVSFTIIQNRWLAKPYKAFGTSYCEDIDVQAYKSQYSTNSSYIYNQFSCQIDCVRRFVFEKCGCRFFLDAVDEPYCSLEKTRDCFLVLRDNANVNMLSEYCKCPKPCTVTEYRPIISVANFASSFIKDYMVKINLTDSIDTIESNMIDLRIHYSGSSVTITEQKPEITLDSIVGNLGGQMGLFLGASVLSVIELTEFFILLLCEFYRNKKQTIKPK